MGWKIKNKCVKKHRASGLGHLVLVERDAVNKICSMWSSAWSRDHEVLYMRFYREPQFHVSMRYSFPNILMLRNG